MSTHGSATALEETLHETETTQITISDALRRRALSVINDRRTDPLSVTLWRSTIRGLLTLCGAPVPEKRSSTRPTSRLSHNEPEQRRRRFIMGTLENSRDPKLLANTGKHFAFSRCGELNLFGMVDAQLAVVEAELLVRNGLIS